VGTGDDRQVLSYFDNDPIVVTSAGVAKVWLARSQRTGATALYAQWAPLPG
jgi:hypothetical protein